MNYLIGVDIGTSATKTVLFDEQCNVIASASKEYPMYQPQNGWAEQKPEDWRDATLETLTKVIKDAGASGADIKGIGLSGQMHGLVMLDENGDVLRPSIIWCDQRTAREVDEMNEKIGRERLIEITANPALTGWTAAKILWVKNHEPEIYAKCKHILLPKDYIRYILTGVFATEVSDASGMQLLDVPNRCWSEEVCEKLGIDMSMLATVYESCEVTGTVKEDIAAMTGLSADTVVVGGAGDNAAAAVGTGIVRDGKAFTTIGTSGVVFAHSSKVTIDPKGRVHTCCCAVPGAWHVMGVTQAAGLSLNWFRNNFCQDYMAEAQKQGCDPYDLMNRDAAQSPVGSNKLIYMPYLMGERTPHLDPDCRGVFFGISAIHKKPDFVRAVMEGVSYSLKDCNDILNEMGIHVQEMMACGGGGKSPLWRQMLADMYDCDVKTVRQQEGPALGVAILAGVGAGLFESVESACDKFISPDQSNQPIEEHTVKYNDFHHIYKKLYSALKDQYKELARL
ncbi:MAG: xylulokinase [Lachnospiraceae bacterium]